MAMSDTTRPDGNDDDDPFDGADDVSSSEVDRELELDDDTSLPWLEGADDEEEYGGGNTGQLIGFIVVGLVALALIIGGLWWATHRGPDEDLVAQGGVIEAPEGDYKERPEDPGGKTFEGTGDSSFAVSEGESRPGTLGTGSSDAQPGFETVAPDSSPTPKASDDASSGTDSAPAGPAVQINAYSAKADAEKGWRDLSQRYSALNGKRYRIETANVDGGTVYRLQVLPGDAAAAKSLCASLKASGLACFVKN